ncbi:C6 transcription factor [Fusarium circinatum]|uniref:C6 transcription factor n=1 Tax=Fusarium circinatum TaxID=48490 RepID=A0A8H5T722_FUSCI|nr:C6 transcription factor [Fusarium circinatum]
MEKKLTRISKACDFCHKRARKCKLPWAEGSLSCLTCIEHDVACTWTRVTAKRGVKPQSGRLAQNTNESCDVGPWMYDERIHGPRDTIRALIDTFFQTVYPVLSHIKDGAVLPSREEALTTAAPATGLLPVFIDNAERSIPAHVRGQDAFRYFPTIASLVLVAFQTRHSSLHHRYLGLFHSLIAEQNLHEEVNWPLTLTEPERQRYRRIFWSMNRLEVHSALVMGHVIRCPEQQTMVAYPSDDSQPAEGNWLIGWNFVTDLYRSLEHVINHYRVKRAGRTVADAYSSRLPPREPPALNIETILSVLQDGLDSLPSDMMTALPPSANDKANLSYPAAENIVLCLRPHDIYVGLYGSSADDQQHLQGSKCISSSHWFLYVPRTVWSWASAQRIYRPASVMDRVPRATQPNCVDVYLPAGNGQFNSEYGKSTAFTTR